MAACDLRKVMSLQFQVEQAAENFKNRIFTWSQTKWYDHSLGYYWMGIISYVHQDSDLPKYRSRDKISKALSVKMCEGVVVL